MKDEKELSLLTFSFFLEGIFAWLNFACTRKDTPRHDKTTAAEKKGNCNLRLVLSRSAVAFNFLERKMKQK